MVGFSGGRKQANVAFDAAFVNALAARAKDEFHDYLVPNVASRGKWQGTDLHHRLPVVEGAFADRLRAWAVAPIPVPDNPEPLAPA